MPLEKHAINMFKRIPATHFTPIDDYEAFALPHCTLLNLHLPEGNLFHAVQLGEDQDISSSGKLFRASTNKMASSQGDKLP